MTERTPPAGALRVGDFLVDPRSGELRGGNAERQTLSGQPLQVLLALAERPGELVTRDELRARLWPADTYVDFEHGLNAVVKRLRDALGDAADSPRYIETVPRRGYRLVASVEAVERPDATAVAEMPVPTPVAGPPPPASRRKMGLAVGAVLATGVAATLAYRSGLWRGEASGEAPTATAAATKRLTFGPGLQTDSSWSPDGRRIAYAADRNGNFDLFVQSLDGSEPVRITSSPANESEPAWSPDAQRLVFRSDEGGGGLFTVALDGGAVRRISGFGIQPAWMPDGRDVAFAGPELRTLYLVKADGGEAPRQILKDVLTNGAWGSFAVHPDGRISLLGVHPERRAGLFLSDRAYRDLPTQLSGTTLPVDVLTTFGRFHWNKAGDAVFMEGFEGGAPAVWRASVAPDTRSWEPPVRLNLGLGGAERAAISPDGATLAFTSTQNAIRAWVFPFDANSGIAPGEGRPVTDEDATIASLNVGPGGDAIYYVEDRPGRAESRSVRSDLRTGESTVLFSGRGTGMVPAPSGRGGTYMLIRPPSSAASTDLEFALMWRHQGGREQLLTPWSTQAVMPTDVRRDEGAVLATYLRRPFTGPASLVEWRVAAAPSTEPARVVMESNDRQFWQGHYSPDGRWITFVVAGLDGSGRLELGLVPADGSPRSSGWTRLAADHMWPDKPRWSPDGRTLYFLSRNASGYFEVWGVRLDPRDGKAAGAPFRIAGFDDPRWHIDPTLGSCEMGVAPGQLVLPMRSVKGSIWLLSVPGT